MAAIYLIRHGQASFDQLNYDQLSPLGHQQAERIGQALQQRQIQANLIVQGTMQRHAETRQGAQKHWASSATLYQTDQFNEFDSDELIAKAFPEFQQKTVVKAWLDTQTHRHQAFQSLFTHAIDRWTTGNNDAEYRESWPAFTTRVITGLNAVIEQAAGKNIVIFTSGGPISAIAQHCLQLNTAATFSLNWTIVNGSLSQLLYSSHTPNKISLASFNEQQHLTGAYLTYR